MDSSIKTLTITGAAASSGSEVKRPRRGISRRKKGEDDTDLDSEGLIKPFQIEKAEVQITAPVISRYITPNPPIQKVQTQPQIQGTTSTVVNKEVKPTISTSVILNPPKVPRVKLQPKVTHVQHVQKQIAGTRKARRISMSLSNLNHRFTRAKRVHDETQKKPIDTIRNYLIEKGVIQMKSRAPEKMLRSMYNDFNMLKDGQAL